MPKGRTVMTGADQNRKQTLLVLFWILLSAGGCQTAVNSHSPEVPQNQPKQADTEGSHQTDPTCCDDKANMALKKAWAEFLEGGAYRMATPKDMRDPDAIERRTFA